MRLPTRLLCLALPVLVMAQAAQFGFAQAASADEDQAKAMLKKGLDLYSTLEFKGAQAALLKVNRTSLSDAEQQTLNEHLMRLPVQIRKQADDDGKKAIEAAFRGHKSMKHVIIVEEDVDIYDSDAVEWALATRFQAHTDAVIMPDQPGSSLDPSGDHSGKKTLITKVGFDATIPSEVDPAVYEKVKYRDVDLDDYL